ncbi:MAG TPA: aldo/keto reductase [Bacteroidota bacterium]|nr:aldo/keto reductase [Bacteroidota bacterium]
MITRRTFMRSSAMGATAAVFLNSTLEKAVTRLDRPRDAGKKVISRRLGKTGIELPVVSMGVMRADNPALVRAALAAGMRHLDTAHGYMQGNNESMLGEVLKDYPRDSFVISTKIPGDDAEGFLEKLDVSLKRLRMEYVDILYLHGATSRGDALAPASLEALRIAKKNGKAKHLGVSTHKNEPEVIRAALESGVFEVVLTSVNYKQDHYAEVKKAISEAASGGLGIVGMKTMAGGFHDKERTKPVNCKAALKWVLQDPNLTTTIPGITSFEMLAENASVNEDITLNEQEKADLAYASPGEGLYCQGCAHCSSDCAKRLPIPDIMRAYMYTYGYRNPALAQDLLRSLGVDRNPCAGCAVCSVRCPKGFTIAERIGDVARLRDVPSEFFS